MLVKGNSRAQELGPKRDHAKRQERSSASHREDSCDITPVEKAETRKHMVFALDGDN